MKCYSLPIKNLAQEGFPDLRKNMGDDLSLT